MNFFMYVSIGPAGEMAIANGFSKPGDHSDLRAEMDVLSNCPQFNNPANSYKPTPIQVIVRDWG